MRASAHKNDALLNDPFASLLTIQGVVRLLGNICLMKRITKIVVAVVAVSALLVITCPSKEKHKRVIRDQLTGLVKSELNTENIDTENPFVKVIRVD